MYDTSFRWQDASHCLGLYRSRLPTTSMTQSKGPRQDTFVTPSSNLAPITELLRPQLRLHKVRNQLGCGVESLYKHVIYFFFFKGRPSGRGIWGVSLHGCMLLKWTLHIRKEYLYNKRPHLMPCRWGIRQFRGCFDRLRWLYSLHIRSVQCEREQLVGTFHIFIVVGGSLKTFVIIHGHRYLLIANTNHFASAAPDTASTDNNHVLILPSMIMIAWLIHWCLRKMVILQMTFSINQWKLLYFDGIFAKI